jgi:beta-lactamase class A
MNRDKQKLTYTRSYYYAPQGTQKAVIRRTRRPKLFVMLLLVSMMGGLGYMLTRPNETDSQAKAVSVPATPLKEISEAELASRINAVISANKQLDIGVSIRDIKSGKAYNYGINDNPFIAASVAKLLTASYYLKKAESGEQSLDKNIDGKSARTHIELMIARSDNASWQSLNDEIGKENIEPYAHSLGLNSYRFEGNTMLTPADVAKLLDNLYQKKLLNKEHSALLLSHMSKDLEERQFIRSYVPNSINVYHKAGWLSDRAHDTAIIEFNDRPFVLVIFTKKRFGPYDFTKGQTVFSQITTASLDSFKAL